MAWMHEGFELDAIGGFTEVDHGKWFEYRKNTTGFNVEFPYLVAVGHAEFRYAKLLKTRAYIVVDEDEFGNPVVEKWHIKNHSFYKNHNS